MSENDPVEPEPASAVLVFGDRVELARRYANALASDGVIRGLVGPREAERMWTRHLLNSAVLGILLEPGDRAVDVGSGAGLPGIPLAIARPDCSIVLVEPLERRVNFLRQIIGDLELTNCVVERGRADQVLARCGGADAVTSRAVAPLATLAGWSAPLLRAGGRLLAIKGASAATEVERDRVAVKAAGLVDIEVLSVGEGVGRFADCRRTCHPSRRCPPHFSPPPLITDAALSISSQ